MSGDFEDVTDQISQAESEELPVHLPSTSEVLRAREMKLPVQQRLELERSISLEFERLASEDTSESSSLFSSLPKSVPGGGDSADNLLLSRASSTSSNVAAGQKAVHESVKLKGAQKDVDPVAELLGTGKSKNKRRRAPVGRKRQRRLPPNEADISGIFEAEPRIITSNEDDAAASREIMAALEQQERVQSANTHMFTAQPPTNLLLPQSSPLSLHRSTSAMSNASNVSHTSGANTPVGTNSAIGNNSSSALVTPSANVPTAISNSSTNVPNVLPQLSPEEIEERERLRREKKERKKREKALRKAEKKRRKQAAKLERERLEALRNGERRVTRAAAAAKAVAVDEMSPEVVAPANGDVAVAVAESLLTSPPLEPKMSASRAKKNGSVNVGNGIGSSASGGGFVYKKRKKKSLVKPASAPPLASISHVSLTPLPASAVAAPSPLPALTMPTLPLPIGAASSDGIPSLSAAPAVPPLPLPSNGVNGKLPLLSRNGSLPNHLTGFGGDSALPPILPLLPIAAANIPPPHVVPLPTLPLPLHTSISPLPLSSAVAEQKTFAALPEAIIPGIQVQHQQQQHLQGQRFGMRLGSAAAKNQSRFAAIP